MYLIKLDKDDISELTGEELIRITTIVEYLMKKYLMTIKGKLN